MQFQKFDPKDFALLRPYFAAQKLHFDNFSVGFRIMWNKTSPTYFTITGDSLVLYEDYDGSVYFNYPVSLDGTWSEEESAISAVEEYCRDRDLPLLWVNVPASRLPLLTGRYADYHVKNERRWRDYLYRAQDFVTYAGKRFSGQRNHVNKFRKLYPNAVFRRATEEDLPRLAVFLKEFEGRQLQKQDRYADWEMRETEAILPDLGTYGMLCGYMEYEGKVIAMSFGEICGDMLVVHVEKALTDYAGVYPATAQAFAAMFVTDDVVYINREDDAGDLGLRKSKLQYNPVELVDKFSLRVIHPLQRLEVLPVLKTERLTLRPVADADLAAYRLLAGDVERNRYWGYDYREDMPKDAPEDYLLAFSRRLFDERKELYLGMYAGDTLVGEVVLHRFGSRGECEVGARLLPEQEGNGYAAEGVRALSDYAFAVLGMERVEAKCYRENARSKAMLLRSGMREIEGDEVFFRFYRTAGM